MNVAEKAPTAPRIHVFYDGGCKVCAWEIRKYLAMDQNSRIGTIDIHHPDFKAAKYGLDAARVRRYFHVLDADKKVLAGVPAFIAIWETLDTPWSRRAVKAARLLPIRAALEVGYACFIRLRPYLPRNAPVGCDDGACEIK
jgi:predicted DCC family thiol-disulfide oxidoreductase YuxK